MKVFPFSGRIVQIFIIGICLTTCTKAFSQIKKANFGIYAGADFSGIKVEDSAQKKGKNTFSPGYFGAIRITTPLSKRIAFLRFQLDLSFRSRHFSLTTTNLGNVQVSEREVQLDPIFSKILLGGGEWNPYVRGGLNINYALKRRLKDASNASYEWKSPKDLFSSRLVAGFGMMHRKSGFFSELNLTYEFLKPDGPPDDHTAITVNWLPLGFNLSAGILFGGGDN